MSLSTDLRVGVSSFGYSGTISHAVLLRADDLGSSLPLTSWTRLAYKRPLFSWSLTQPADAGRCPAFSVSWAAASRSPALSASNSFVLILGASHPLSTQQAEARSSVSCRSTAVLVLSTEQSTAPALMATQLLLALLKRLTSRLLLVTCAVQAGTSRPLSGGSNAAHSSGWGMLRVLRIEDSSVQALSMDASSGSAKAIASRLVVRMGMAESEVAWVSGAEQRVARLRRITSSGKAQVVQAGSYSITGGLGGLGLRAASSLIARGAACVLLASRSGRVVRDGQGLDGQLRSFGNASKVVACDASDSGDVEALVGLQDICSGILHAAGVLRDVLIRSMSNESVQLVLSSKAGGASMMDRATACVPVAAFGLFSSVASTFGNVGQGNYASANAYLDASHCTGARKRPLVRACRFQPSVGLVWERQRLTPHRWMLLVPSRSTLLQSACFPRWVPAGQWQEELRRR